MSLLTAAPSEEGLKEALPVAALLVSIWAGRERGVTPQRVSWEDSIESIGGEGRNEGEGRKGRKQSAKPMAIEFLEVNFVFGTPKARIYTAH